MSQKSCIPDVYRLAYVARLREQMRIAKLLADARRRGLSTRDAVETSIDISKELEKE